MSRIEEFKQRFRELFPIMSYPEEKEFVWELLDEILQLEYDLNHCRAILDGSWPNAKEILENSLKKVEEHAAQRRQD